MSNEFKTLVDAFHEINFANYCEDDARALQNWGLEVHPMLERLARADAEMPKFTLVCNKDLTESFDAVKHDDALVAIAKRDARISELEAMQESYRRSLRIMAAKPVAEITCNGVMGVSFKESCNYGCDLPVGSLLYLGPQTAAALEPITEAHAQAAWDIALRNHDMEPS